MATLEVQRNDNAAIGIHGHFMRAACANDAQRRAQPLKAVSWSSELDSFLPPHHPSETDSDSAGYKPPQGDWNYKKEEASSGFV